ncbi:MAG: CDP-diacylglycerol--serine O-phosphatidyltransferase [Gemmatimonadetes bacterium]|nr:CDP-diacylglycerol--serine O-phosphatidyltransferase [Gemmatimonadota bacterium]
MRRPALPRPSLVMLPNGLTLGSLFFGIFAIVAASRGEHVRAGWYIVMAAFLDMFDGRIARATNTGSRFGEELDSLVDAISFGVAPALMMYFAELNHTGWDWIFVWLYVACAVMRLARFNVEQAGKSKVFFQGLPSPAAGGTLATYYWFSQTTLYQETIIGDLPWQSILRFLMIGLAFLMISNVPYPAWPRFSLRNWYGVFGIFLFLGVIAGTLFLPKQFFFPLGVAYTLSGIVIAITRGLFDMPSPFGVTEDDEDDEEAEMLAAAPADARRTDDHHHRRRRRSRHRGERGGPDSGAPEGSTP